MNGKKQIFCQSTRTENIFEATSKHLTLCHYYVTHEFQSESTLYSLAKWWSVCLRTKWLWVRIPLLSIKAFALNVLLIGDKRQDIKQLHISKHDSERKGKVIPLIIIDGEIWHYLTVQKLSALLQGVSSKDNANYYCINRSTHFE